MSFTNNDQVFHSISQQELAEIIACALRKDHGHHGSSVKQIARMTGFNPRAVRNWYEARNMPGLSGFLRLMQCSPTLVKTVLELSGQAELSAHIKTNITTHAGKIYSDNSVTVNVTLGRNILLKLNPRQLWFYGRLQKGLSLKAEDIADIWGVNARTARRDIAGLMDIGLIEFSGASKNGRYVLVE